MRQEAPVPLFVHALRVACVALVGCAAHAPVAPARVPLREPAAATLIAQQRHARNEASEGGHGAQDGFDVGTTLVGPRRAPRSAALIQAVHVASDEDAQHVVGLGRAAVDPVVELSARYSLLRRSYEVDAVTGASEVSVTTADGLEVGGRYDDGERELGAAAGVDLHDDQDRLWGVLGGSLALGAQLELGVALGYAATSVQRVGDPSFDESRSDVSGSLRLRLAPDPSRALSLAYALSRQAGFLGDPYAVVLLGPLPFPEEPPEERLRHALLLRFGQRLGSPSLLSVQLRGYLDDWGVRSLALRAAYDLELDALLLGGYARGYWQSEADFVLASYPTGYAGPRTADRRLQTVEGLDFGVQGGGLWSLGEHTRLRLLLTLDYRHQLHPSPAPFDRELGIGVLAGITL